MANIAPESGGLNRGRWRQIEEGVRFLAEVAGPVEVVTGCCGGRRVLKGGEVVPSYWFKIIYTPGIGRPLLILVQNRKRGKVLFSKRPLQVLKRSCPTLFP
jgi:endonuclease G